MTTKQKQTLQTQIRELLVGYGYAPSSRSDTVLAKTTEGREVRYRFNANALRKEVALEERYYGQKQWVRVASGFWKNLSIVDGKIVGLKR
jgi:hypothetical protein